jgi:hypothetical protein
VACCGRLRAFADGHHLALVSIEQLADRLRSADPAAL